MSKIREKLRTMNNFKRKLMVAFFLVLFIPAIVIGALSYENATKTLEKQILKDIG